MDNKHIKEYAVIGQTYIINGEEFVAKKSYTGHSFCYGCQGELINLFCLNVPCRCCTETIESVIFKSVRK